MLRIEGLNVSYDSERILNGIDLEVKAGETLAIIGESGAGKTTLGLSIMGLLNGNARGRIAFDGVDLLSLSKDEMRELRWNRIAMVFQNDEDVLNPVHTVLGQVLEPMVEHRLKNKEEAEQRASQLLSEAGLSSDKFYAYPYQLSGGEQQRALVAMAWANEPELIILDEPLSSLDAVSRLEMMELLKRMGRGRTILVVTHDITAAANLATSIATMYGGRIVERGATPAVLYNPRHPYTRALLRSYPGMATGKDLQGIKGRMTRGVSGCPFHPRCTQAIEICRREVPLLVKYRERLIACHRGGIIPALSVKGMSKSFGSVKAVDNVSLVIDGGGTLALVGQSGSGKTTLAKAITGIIKADAGDVYLEGEKVSRRGKDFYRRVQMIFQKPGEALSHRLSVLEAVKEPLDIQGIETEAKRINRVKKVLEEVELSTSADFLEEYPHHLSGGELQRVTIARALVLDPQVLIADEPTSFLDSSVQAKILKLLLNLQEQRGLSMLFITHDIAVARKISDRMAVMLGGKIIEEGQSSGILASPAHPYTQSLLKAAQGNSQLG
ncbi:MAG: ABC transporter ATP-binding protein [Dehalococcoidia bacterium]|nr:ABC transporter ATP-binding protein [Dehalococcoidia bacterium]